MDKVLLALFGLIGVIVGHYFTKRRDEQARQQNLKLNAYGDLLRGLAGIARNLQTEEEKAKFREASDIEYQARMRVAICGSPEVVRCINHFLDTGEGYSLGSKDSQLARVKLCQTMRNELLPKGSHVLDDDMFLLVSRKAEP